MARREERALLIRIAVAGADSCVHPPKTTVADLPAELTQCQV